MKNIWMPVIIEGYKFTKPFPITNDPKEINDLVDHFYIEWALYWEDRRNRPVPIYEEPEEAPLRREFAQAYRRYRNNPTVLGGVINNILHRYRHFWKYPFMRQIALEEREKYDEMHK